MKSLKWLILSFVLAAVCYSCSNDFDIIGDYEDTTIVYGILEAGQDTHYIKINKAFLGKGNANDYALVADSSNYEDILEVKVEVIADGELVNTVVFERMTLEDYKETGAFYSPNEIAYRGIEEFKENEDKEYVYELKIYNTKTKKQVSSNTTLVRNFVISDPVVTSMKFELDGRKTTIKWYAAQYGRKYEAKAEVYYTEKMYDGEEVVKSVNWNGLFSGDMEYEMTNKGSAVLFSDNFFKLIENNIGYSDESVEENVEYRLMDSLTCFVNAAGDDLSTYLDVANNSGLSEDTPDYTNIENGIGVFSSRRKVSRSFTVSQLTTKALMDAYPELKFKIRNGN